MILVEKRHGGSWVVHTHHDSKIAGTFAQQLGWVFVGPCHPSAHGPPAKLGSFTSLQMVHTHTSDWFQELELVPNWLRRIARSSFCGALTYKDLAIPTW